MSRSRLALPEPTRPADPGLVERLLLALEADAPAPPPPAAPDLPALVAALWAVEDSAVRWHRSLGLPEPTTAETLADVGRKVDSYGADADLPWLVGLLRGDVVAVGRLQYERLAGPAGRALHIPEGGPLDPAAVSSSLARAEALLGTAEVHCTTWLFDPALRELPADSNIAAFTRRFAVGPARPSDEGDQDVCRFLFRRPMAEVLDPRAVRPRTRLERLAVDRLRAGYHWSVPRGVLTTRGTTAPSGALALG
ncbi:DUF5596 domain-containing protein [Phycicoccus endophyticus]|uniref:DUF5596 domain-containing protein n=1 Tax=Phycicoccus endophyticus TaxID=1690220 RepID=A0A7G9R121_9MICO|nr:acyltransferase domain-containing protein [Phycicoccus endophyticus]NHI20576.1 DUF5596 domain-containing protein [Phycicoccus endophyticus]QNN49296.1 DUF5596 domain-containing protein [Phycicoccus endophyticus]GGL44982.1 hypothetical protein GCM10012283_29440 [Phycicoccus endophyticus]